MTLGGCSFAEDKPPQFRTLRPQSETPSSTPFPLGEKVPTSSFLHVCAAPERLPLKTFKRNQVISSHESMWRIRKAAILPLWGCRKCLRETWEGWSWYGDLTRTGGRASSSLWMLLLVIMGHLSHLLASPSFEWVGVMSTFNYHMEFHFGPLGFIVVSTKKHCPLPSYELFWL